MSQNWDRILWSMEISKNDIIPSLERKKISRKARSNFQGNSQVRAQTRKCSDNSQPENWEKNKGMDLYRVHEWLLARIWKEFLFTGRREAWSVQISNTQSQTDIFKNVFWEPMISKICSIVKFRNRKFSWIQYSLL